MSKTNIQPAENEFIIGLRQNDPLILKKLYDSYFPKIASMIRHNNGTDADAWDVFQDGVMIVYKKTLDENFLLTASFYSFLYAVCWKVWMKKLSKKSNKEVTLPPELEFIDEHKLELAIEHRERWKLYQEKFAELSDRCRQLLQLFLEKNKMKAIAKIMGYSSESVVKKEKFKCKKRLISLVEADPKFRELKY